MSIFKRSLPEPGIPIHRPSLEALDIFADPAAILVSIVLNSYYGMPRGQIHINLPPENPIMSFETIEIKLAAVSAKRFITYDLLIARKLGL